MIIENQNRNKETGLGEIGSRLLNKYPDFDVRNYGYGLLSKFLEEETDLILNKNRSSVTVSIRNKDVEKNDIEKYILNLMRRCDVGRMSIGAISQQVREKYNHFNVKDFGYTRFSKFLQSLEGIEVNNNIATYTIKK